MPDAEMNYCFDCEHYYVGHREIGCLKGHKPTPILSTYKDYEGKTRADKCPSFKKEKEEKEAATGRSGGRDGENRG
jgi:hypothetical protein